MQCGADRGGVKMTKRLEVLIEQIPVGIDAALITGYEIIRYGTVCTGGMAFSIKIRGLYVCISL